MTEQDHIDDLRTRFNGGESLKFVFFWGHRLGAQRAGPAFLSQWFPASFRVEGLIYPTAEHFMMAEKASLFRDPATREQILRASTPGEAKALGRQIRSFDEATWREHRFSIVVRGNREKFRRNPALAQYLHETGSRVLVEASPVDLVWGIGLDVNDERVHNPNL
jgi:ribA/ribD-fused uncharacterized protein